MGGGGGALQKIQRLWEIIFPHYILYCSVPAIPTTFTVKCLSVSCVCIEVSSSRQILQKKDRTRECVTPSSEQNSSSNNINSWISYCIKDTQNML